MREPEILHIIKEKLFLAKRIEPDIGVYDSSVDLAQLFQILNGVPEAGDNVGALFKYRWTGWMIYKYNGMNDI